MQLLTEFPDKTTSWLEQFVSAAQCFPQPFSRKNGVYFVRTEMSPRKDSVSLFVQQI